MNTLSEKIIAKHLVKGQMIKGQPIEIKIDQTLTQDATGTMAYLQLEALGIEKVKTEVSVSYVDHNTLQSGFEKDDYIFKSINKQLQKKNDLKSACIQEKKQLKFSIYITIEQKDTLYKNIRESRKNNCGVKGNKK